MPKHKTITDQAAKKFSVKSGRDDHFDTSYPGLALRVSQTGRKAWTYFFRLKNGKVILHRMTLGIYPAMSVEQAHDAWRKARDLVLVGRDPRAVDGSTAAGPTDLESVIDEWIKRDQSKNRSAKLVGRRMKLHVLPSWKNRDVREISRHNCLALLDGIADGGKVVLARRVFSHLHRFFRWCVGRGIIDANPLLDAEKPGSEEARARFLEEAELIAVWKAASEIQAPYRDAVRLLILTGARREEISALRWSEIKDGAINLEGERTKNGRPHVIPISSAARSILDGIERKGEFVFTSSGSTSPGNWSRARNALAEISGVTGWRIHDLRRTVSTRMQRLKILPFIIDAIQGHAVPGVKGIYQRYDYLDEKRVALETWGAHVTDLVEGREPGQVVPLPRRA